jgi:hypothetical protein
MHHRKPASQSLAVHFIHPHGLEKSHSPSFINNNNAIFTRPQ